MSAELAFQRHFRHHMGGEPCRGCYQLLGVDVILRQDATPVVIEVGRLLSETSIQIEQ